MEREEKIARAIATYELGMGDAPDVIKSVVDAHWKDYVKIAKVVLAALEDDDITSKTAQKY